MLTQYEPQRIPVEKFVSDLRDVCGRFDVRHEDGSSSMLGGVALDTRAGIEIVHVAASVNQIVRTSRDIRQDGGENYFLILQQSGKALMSQNETSCVLNTGDMILIDSAEPSEFTFFGAQNRQISIHLPRNEIQARFGYDMVRGGLAVPRSNPSNIAIQGILQSIFNKPVLNPLTQDCLREALMGVLGAVLYEQSGREDYRGIESDLGGARAYTMARAYIDANFRSADFSLQDMADELGFSLRQIQRAFAASGTDMTPTKYLMVKRLEHTRRGLDAHKSGKRDDHISSIAYEAGFSDLSYFYRCFRKYFGKTPRGYLEV